MKNKIYADKSMCCGCGTCSVVCPTNAITMKEDEYGFIFPSIEENICIKCGKCVRACAFQNKEETNNVQRVYAACSNNTNIKLSTSGGVYASIATWFIKNGGHVFGAAFEKKQNRLVANHIEVQELDTLKKTLGSKYVQDQAADSFRRIKELLNERKDVLFAGTPCQVGGLKSYLNEEYNNLLTIDIICHGVPSIKMLQDYCAMIEKIGRFSIEDICFRDKTQGWNLAGRILGTRNGKKIHYNMRVSLSSYYYLFLCGTTYRESCYHCKYANRHRPGDISIGDYWGIEKIQPELLRENGGPFIKDDGISCLMINNRNGIQWFEKVKDGLIIRDATFDNISKYNGQLNYPSKENADRSRVMNIYKIYGYTGVERWFVKKQGIKFYLRLVKNIFFSLFNHKDKCNSNRI